MRSLIVLAAVALPLQAQSNFWRELGDSTLNRLVAEATRNGTDVRAAEARVDASRASRRLSVFDLAPTVTATGSAFRTRQSIAQVPGVSGPLPQRDLYDVGFDAAWELDLFGRVRRGVNAQSAFAEASEHSLDDVKLSLSAEVARAYFEFRGAQQLLAVATRSADNQRKTVKLTEDRLAAGRGTAFDVERAKTALSLTLATLPNLRAQIDVASYRITALTGGNGEIPRVARDDSRSGSDIVSSRAEGEGSRRWQFATLPDSLRNVDVRELVKKRPDVLAAERRAAAQVAAVGAAQADYMPRVSLGMNAGYTANEFQSLTRTGTSRVLFGPIVSYPLLDLGRVKQRVGIAAARREEAAAQQTATVLAAVAETEGTVVSYNAARERLRILDDAVRSSERAAALAQQRFEAGLTDFLQVLDAQRTLLDAESQLTLGQTAAATSLIAFYKATGGAWPTR
jgi:NodT family efflux transporter outer membrane factor (OMF) lipoprotein